MQDFTLQELYEISDGLNERRLRLFKLRDLGGTSETLDRLIAQAESAHTKISNEIIRRISTI